MPQVFYRSLPLPNGLICTAHALLIIVKHHALQGEIFRLKSFKILLTEAVHTYKKEIIITSGWLDIDRRPLPLPADHSTAGIIVALAILPAGLLWPALASLAYMFVFLGNIWCWAICSSPRRFSLAALRLLQTYTGQLSVVANIHF